MTKTVHSLADRYDLTKTAVFLTGPQAIVRLMLMQSELDRLQGLNTAGYVSGYRGSPVGTVDAAFQSVRGLLEPRNIKFELGLNEELAATALWGTQQAEMRGEGRFDGVFSIWYGKGPGVDRSGDVLRHANMAGTSPHGGVLAIAGDDHSGESSTVVHASDLALIDAMIPVLSPAGVQEIIDLGLFGFALSRYAGVWAGLKVVHDTVESAAVVAAPLERPHFVIPADHVMPPGGLSIRPRDDRVPQEARLHTQKIPAVLAFARANGINRMIFKGGRKPKLGLIAAGKAYLDLREALDQLGIDESAAQRLGIRLLKLGMSWPLDPVLIGNFADGLETVMVVEEKRPVIESQIRDILYARPKRPSVIGKTDEEGEPLFASHGVVEPNEVALAIAARLADPKVSEAARNITASLSGKPNLESPALRVPYFCAGCPHNSSTVLPEGARGYAGIGCHWLAQFVPDRKTEGATQMGGEGANWVGEASFSTRRHVFQNIGDGTYNHSGLLAIRHAIHSGANITYKILFNDAVAMTGGQRNDGGLTVPQIAQEMRAFGVERIAVVSDEPDKYDSPADFPRFVSFHHRDDLQEVQKELSDVTGVSVLIYDQTCAAEKRRRRRKGEFPDPNRRVFINELVCEGCGDCGVQSNCVAIAPVETEFGRKRQIDQSSCNKDFSCLKGFCPSFVTVEGGELVKGSSGRADLENVPFPVLPEPALPPLARPWNIMIAGIGGTGVVTIGHVLGQAAHIETKGAALIDMVGISQKNGAVVTHLKLAAKPDDIAAVRVAKGTADLILGCDLATAASAGILAGAARGRTKAVVNIHETMPGLFTHDADFDLGGSSLELRIASVIGREATFGVDASAHAVALLGDSIAANLFMLGFAYQKGLIPLSAASIAEALRLNGVAVKMNLDAFTWGRRAAHDAEAVTAIIERRKPKTSLAHTLDEVIEVRAKFLEAYQDLSYAETYRDFVTEMRNHDKGNGDFSDAVARSLFKLMAYKDEYEVARLYTDGVFAEAVSRQFTGDYKLHFHLAPPSLAGSGDQAGRPRKKVFGPWMMPVFRVLARMKGLRGTAFDIFGRSEERRSERAMIESYKASMQALAKRLSPQSYATIVEIAKLPQGIRGFGPVKAENARKAAARELELLKSLLPAAGDSLRAAAE